MYVHERQSCGEGKIKVCRVRPLLNPAFTTFFSFFFFLVYVSLFHFQNPSYLLQSKQPLLQNKTKHSFVFYVVSFEKYTFLELITKPLRGFLHFSGMKGTLQGCPKAALAQRPMLHVCLLFPASVFWLN